MAKRKPEEPKPGAPAWQCTFADLMNLLLCFFVLLFSMSTVDAQKFEMIAASFSETFSIFTAGASAIGDGVLVSNGVSQLNELDQYINSTGKTAESATEVNDMSEYEALAELLEQLKELAQQMDEDQSQQMDEETLAELLEKLKALAQLLDELGLEKDDLKALGMQMDEFEALAQQMETEKLAASEALAEKVQEAMSEKNLDKDVDITFTSEYVQLTLKGSILFDSGKSELKQEALPTIDKVAMILERYAESTIEIEGHTDNVPISTSKFESNDVLSSYRALSMFNYLVENTSLDPALLKHSGRGEYIPVADNSTPEGRAKNRRIEIKIYNTLSGE